MTGEFSYRFFRYNRMEISPDITTFIGCVLLNDILNIFTENETFNRITYNKKENIFSFYYDSSDRVIWRGKVTVSWNGR